MKANKNSTPRIPCPKGTHIAILVGIIDYGTQTDKFGDRRKIELLWETPEELHVFNEERGEEPFIIDRKFALTIGKKSALKECLEGLTGEKIEDDEIDVEAHLETVGQLAIAHNKDGEYTNVEIMSYSPLSKSDSKRKFATHNDPIVLDLDNFDIDVWKSGHFLLPDWKKDIIRKSPEFKELASKIKELRLSEKSKEVSSTEEEEEEEEEKPTRKSGGKAAAKATSKAPAKKSANKLFSRKK